MQDTTRSYWPSSPSNGAVIDDKEMGLYIQMWGDSQNTSVGDIHRFVLTAYVLINYLNGYFTIQI